MIPAASQAAGMVFYMQLAISLENLGGDFRSHPAITGRTGMQVIAGIVFRQKIVGIFRIAQGFVKIDTAVY